MTGAKLRERERFGEAAQWALKVEEGTVHQEMEAEAEKGKETDSPLEIPEKERSADTLLQDLRFPELQDYKFVLF